MDNGQGHSQDFLQVSFYKYTFLTFFLELQSESVNCFSKITIHYKTPFMVKVTYLGQYLKVCKAVSKQPVCLRGVLADDVGCLCCI